jgi:hypothetical protein
VPQACERTVAIFDGHTRYNLRLAFERLSTVRAAEGYEGQLVVNRNLACACWQNPHSHPLSGLHFNAHGRWGFGSNKICICS